MDEIIVALTTLPADFDAEALARGLVDARVAACVTLIPAIRSIYRWQGQVEDSTEQQLVIKSTRGRLDALWKELRSRHPYEVPEFLVLGVSSGSEPYLSWIRGETGDKG
jgi:periplasmic divalent cation tolerance protein